MRIYSQAYGIDNTHHMVPDTRPRSTAVVEDWFRIIDSHTESGSLVVSVLLAQGIKPLSHSHR